MDMRSEGIVRYLKKQPSLLVRKRGNAQISVKGARYDDIRNTFRNLNTRLIRILPEMAKQGIIERIEVGDRRYRGLVLWGWKEVVEHG